MVEKQMNAAVSLQNQSLAARKFSKSGIASILIAIGFLFFEQALFAISVLRAQTGYQEARAFLLLIALGGIGGAIVHVAGLIVGVLGTRQKQRSRLLPIFGIVLNSVLLIPAGIL